jgi:hypothetical protein
MGTTSTEVMNTVAEEPLGNDPLAATTPEVVKMVLAGWGWPKVSLEDSRWDTTRSTR